MDDLLKPDEEMLAALATELGLLSLVAAAPQSDQKPADSVSTSASKGLSLT
jgi:hypothetical protein